MINLILLFPVFACLMLFFLKKDCLNNIFINIYAGIHFLISLSACIGVDLIPAWKSCSFFELNERNTIFLMIMSIVFLAVAIYNNGYMKNEVTEKYIREALTEKELKEIDQMKWVGLMNTCKAQAEEIAFSELLYV